MPHPKSKRSSHVSTKEKPFPSPSSGGSKPIKIVRSSKHKVMLVLPPHTLPPISPSSPSHRTAPSPHPVLISSSYPGRHHLQHYHHSPSSSLPSTSHVRSGSGGSYHHQYLQVPVASGSGMHHSPPSPSRSVYLQPPKGGSISRSASHDSYYTRSTITPTKPRGILKNSNSSKQYPTGPSDSSTNTTPSSSLEDEYYSHPAVRAYEMEKAAEQAMWTRQRMMSMQHGRGSGEQQRGRDPHPKKVHYDYDSSRATITPTQQRW